MGCLRLTYRENADRPNFLGLWKKGDGSKNREDYYPFGLTFNSYQRENSTINNYLYNGKEKQDELDLGWLDYGARMYMSDIGKFSSIDKRAQNYMRDSPYGYVTNDPINNVDIGGNFKLPKDLLGNFKRLEQYLEHGIQGVLDNKRIVNALKKHGGFSDAQLKEAFTWGSGPTVLPAEAQPGAPPGFSLPIKGTNTFALRMDLVDALEKAQGKDRDYLLFLIAVTILHEYVHIGHLNNDLPPAIEEGNDFERDAYGERARESTGAYKRILDKWMEEHKEQLKKEEEEGSKKKAAAQELISSFGSLESGTYIWNGSKFVKK